MSRVARVLGQVLGVVLITAGLLAVLELAAGFWVHEKPPPAPTPEIPGDTVSRTLTWLELNPAPLVRDADLLWRNTPGARKTQPINPQPYRHDDTWTIENNGEGFRGPERPQGATPDVFRILCVGDSITFGFNVDQPDAYPRQLERLLAARHPGRRFDVVNAGVPGWSWLQGLRFLEVRGLALRPDVVIEGHGTNDQFLPARVTDEERFHRLGGPVARALRATALRLTETNSYRLVEQIFPPPPFSPDQDSPGCKAQIAKEGICRRVTVDQIRAAVGEVRKLVAGRNAGLVLINLDFVETAAVTGVRQAAERLALPFIDAVDHVRKLRSKENAARTTQLGLAAPTVPDADAPGPKHVVLRVLAPDRDAAYEVRGAAAFRPQVTFATPLFDDGTHGDERGADGVYSATVEVPAGISRVEYLFYRDGEPELRALPPMSSTVGNRVLNTRADATGPVDTFGQLQLMAERAHPNRDGQRIVAELVLQQLETMPAFRRFVGDAGPAAAPMDGGQ